MSKYFKRDYNHSKVQKAGKERDGYICMVCGRFSDKAEGHHVIELSEGGPASINNIITLCSQCHKDYHRGVLKIDIGTF